MIQSVITHAPFDWVERCARRLSTVVADPNGVVVGTYLDGQVDYHGMQWAYPECISYRRETLQELFASVGLTWRVLDRYLHPAGVTWFLLSRLAG